MNLIAFEVVTMSKGEIDMHQTVDRILREAKNNDIAYSENDVQHEWSLDKKTWKLLLPIVNQISETQMHGLRSNLDGVHVYLIVGS